MIIKNLKIEGDEFFVQDLFDIYRQINLICCQLRQMRFVGTYKDVIEYPYNHKGKTVYHELNISFDAVKL